MKISENREILKSLLLQFHDSVVYHQKLNPEMGIGQIADGFIKNECDMEEGMKQYCDWINECQRRNKRLLRAVKTIKGKTFCKHLMRFIKDAEAVDYTPWEIVSEPIGKQQAVSEYGREIKKEWVDQYETGTEGDTWAGTICVQLKPNKYLKFNFSM